jgi:hypothetical protein
MDAAHFRSEAAKCRALAKVARDRMTARNLLALATDYDAQALQLDLGPRAEPVMPKAR